MQLTYEQHREISDFVSREVIYCVSALVQTLMGTVSANQTGLLSDGTSYEDIMKICVQEDWEAPAREHIENDMDRDELIVSLESLGYFNVGGNKDFGGELIAELEKKASEDKGEAWRDFAESEGLNPYTVEAYEHWIVTNWLADKLEEKGEMIGRDICGLTIWGRTTTGQAISMDSVIQEIYKELQEK